MSREILNDIIANFETEKFINFFRSKTPDFAPSQERLPRYDDSDFANFKKLGEIGFLNSEQRLIIISAEAAKSLSERSGKKAQYEKAKKILRELDRYEVGIFIFHDKTGSFRFSLVYEQTLGARRAFSNFKRFTYFVDINQTNKTFLKQIGDGDFSSLEKIKERFSVEKVTKDFYREVSNWYFWAIKNVVFPEDAEKDRNKRNSFAVIRLITRIIFIWFMKEKGLMPAYLFDEEKVKNFLKNLSENESSYYKAILQNLFFATLNTPINKRGFRKERGFHGRNKDFMNHHIYRYEKYFKDSDYILKLFKGIPFLNGGLFECLDKSIKKEDKSCHVRIDGFSDRKDNSLKVPNSLFFSEELEVDLNKDYGTKTKKYKTRGLVNILKSYNFTIDENTLIDEEIALDPELLGRVFENLLASYNPETSTTARKATGSYYTPRMIVDYMVNESLKAYFKNRLAEVKDIDEKLTDLLSYSEENHRFNNSEVNILIEAINELKIIDPAVGSGAFPMGILQKLVFVLSKLDPHNTKWKQEQIKAVEKNISDDVLKRDLIEKIEANFENNELDYGRKLYLIQNCIYGVDIQPIAIQICKLRFFISLLVDEKSNDNEKKNFGIEPLPNLETKFVSANSLIGLKKMGQLFLPTSDVIALEKELNEIRRKHFTASRRKEKENLRKKDAEIREKLTKLLEGSIFSSETAAKLASWDPYNPNASADFFDPEWMFGVKVFDIVIANPPYVDSEEMTKNQGELRDKYRDIYIFAQGNWDLFIVFIELGLSLCNKNGTCSFIVKNTLIAAPYSKKLRAIVKDECSLLLLRDYSNVDVFREQDVYPVVFVIKNSKSSLPTKFTLMSNERIIQQENVVPRKVFSQDIFWDKYFFSQNIVDIVTKLSYQPKLKEHKEVYIDSAATVSEAYKIKELLKDGVEQDSYCKKFINTGTIDRYKSLWGIKETQYIKDRYQRPVLLEQSLLKLRGRRMKQANSPKIIIAGMSKVIECYLDLGAEYLAGKSTTIVRTSDIINLKILCAFLNSKLASFWYRVNFNSLAMSGGYLNINRIEEIPVPRLSKLDERTREKLSGLVDKILKKKKQNPDADTSDLETQIDQLVYKLYNLTPEETEIVEKFIIKNK